jgi:hypothetical protein
MVRLSRQAKERSVSHRRCRPPAVKTGAKKDVFPQGAPQGYRLHKNAVASTAVGQTTFIEI